MTIAQLPRATVHLLGSAQVLTTSLSLVKELIDNALDARATAIDILISQDTLEKIEVRDNGHGIAKEDLDALGRRGYTSKLRSFEELQGLGGATLGFRGEALASAVELGEVSVTTKTDGDPTATVVKLKALGGISQQSRASHPIGTTVSVSRLMARIPVRKQTALKQAPKTLARIKELLYSYALARPSVRLNLRVTKGHKGAWSFAPRPNDGIKEAVSQVIGRDAAAQCLETARTFPRLGAEGEGEISKGLASDGIVLASAQAAESLFHMHAFMPRIDADPAKVGSGQYISIDSRPVACDKGTMKKMVTMFKKYVQNRVSQNSQDKLKNPFLLLSINCPLASYDPNVEPAKDDVLFANEELILKSVEELFKETYGICAPPIPAIPTRHVEKLDNFELLLNRSSATEKAAVQKSPFSTEGENIAFQEIDAGHMRMDLTTERLSPTVMEQPGSPIIGSLAPRRTSDPSMREESPLEPADGRDEVFERRRKWDFDMSRNFAEKVQGQETSFLLKHSARQLGAQTVPDETGQDANAGLNPWVIAKLNAPVRETGRHNPLALPDIIIYEGAHDVQPENITRQEPSQPQLYDNRASNPVMTRDQSTSPPIFITEPLLEAVPQRRLLHTGPEDDLMLLGGDQRAEARHPTDFISARHLPQDLLLTPPATQRGSLVKRLVGPTKPFISPLRSFEPMPGKENLRQTKLATEYQLPCKEGATRLSHEGEPAADLSWAMQYEERKEEATQRRRQEIRLSRIEAARQAQIDSPRSSPHRNRYEAAISSLEVPRTTEKDVLQPRMHPGDPRAYLMRRQKLSAAENEQSGGVQKLKRMKTNMLPLETICNTDIVCKLVQTVSFESRAIREIVVGLSGVDPYVTKGLQTFGVNKIAASAVKARLEHVFRNWVETKVAANKDVEYDFTKLMDDDMMAEI